MRHLVSRAEFIANTVTRVIGMQRPGNAFGHRWLASRKPLNVIGRSQVNGIVCHCELVTRREINQALDGPIACHSLAGLKRRTRVTMGRCQGFYCSAELSELTQGKFPQPIGIARK